MRRPSVADFVLSSLIALAMLVGSPRTGESSLPLVTGAPALTVPGSQTIEERQALSFGVTAVDPEGQSVELSASNLPAGALFTDHHDNTGTFDWTPDSFQAGSYVVFFLADDTFGGLDAESVAIDVQNANTPPVLDPIGDRTVNQGATTIVTISGSDADGDALAYSTSGLPGFATFTDYGDGTASLVASPGSSTPPGSSLVTVTLRDGTASDSKSFTLTVAGTSVQHAPALVALGDITVNEGVAASVPVSASDSDGDALTWSVTLPGFATFQPGAAGPGSALATIDLNPGYCASGRHAATVSVSDGGLSASESFVIDVTDVTRAPVWEGPYAVTLLEGGIVDRSVRALDPDQECGAPASVLTIVSSDAGSALAATLTDSGDGSGTLHLEAAVGGAGLYQLVLRAVDSGTPQLTRDTQVSVTVGAVNRAPVAEAGGPYSGVLGVAVTFLGTGSSDPDGDSMSYLWDFGDGRQAAGASASHEYTGTGVYSVTLTVSDGVLSAQDGTAATITISYSARAWGDPDVIRLHTGKPSETVLLEPVGGSFDLTRLNLTRLSLCAPPGTGSVACIQPIPGKTTLDRDRDHNGIVELAMRFSMDDLRSLFANVTQRGPVALTLEGALVDGSSIRAGWVVEVIPERRGLLRKVSPNPVNPDAVVSLTLDRPGAVSVRVYDLGGRLVRSLLDRVELPAGDHDLRFDGRSGEGRPLASGRYLVRVEASGEVETGSITVLR